jgi:ribosome-binding factor A
MSTTNARNARIAAQIKRALAMLLQRGLNDPRVGNVTVTAVRLGADLRVAYVSVLPFGAPGGESMLSGLRSAAGFLRGQLAGELKLRHAPRLEFELDHQLRRAQELTELIDRTVAADTRAADDERREH